jgi:transcriptional regulator with XRE-family HTH domain
MHTPETREKFIERRAQGWPLARLVTELGVARSTLIEWSRQLRFEIQNRRAVELEALAERLLGTRQSRAAALSARLALIEGELKKRDLAQVSTARLLALSAALQRELRAELGDFRCASPLKDIPSDEYVEEIQEWTL